MDERKTQTTSDVRTDQKVASTESPEQQAAVATVLLDEAALYTLANTLDLTEWDAISLAEERERLQSKEGVTKERLAVLDRRKEIILARAPQLASRFEQSRIPVVEVKEGVAVVQGRVYDVATRSGLPGLVIVAANPQGQALARASTDARGGFTMQVDPVKAPVIMLEVRSGKDVVFLDEKPFQTESGKITQRDIPVNLNSTQKKTKTTK